LVIDFATTTYMGGSGQGNPESLVRWVKQKDGTFKHDFTNFDRYLEMVAQAIGKPRTLRLNCWGAGQWGASDIDKQVTVYDPASGRLSTMKQPPLGTPENNAFWKPVFDGVLARLKARGWLDETTLGYNPWNGAAPPTVVDVAYKLWPQGKWSWTGHNPQEGAMAGSQTGIVMKVRNANTVYSTADPGRTPAWLLDGPRRSTIIWTARMLQSDYSPLREIRRLEELYGLMAGYDGLGEFGADLFPVKTPVGGYATPAAGAGTGWVSLGRSTLALLYPGPDGPVATERFEMFREGTELCEAVLFIRQAMADGKLIGAIKNKIEDYLHRPAETVVGGAQGARRVALDGSDPEGKRLSAFNRGTFAARYMHSAEDTKLLDLVDEVLAYGRILGSAKAYGLKATGGTFTNLTDGYWVHRFTKVGTAQFIPSEDIMVEYLVVGGGGGGATGSSAAYGTGGGGAGGLVTSVSGCYSGGGTPGTGSPPSKPVQLKAGTAYTVTVGDGGAAGANGQDSAFGNPGAEFARAKGGGGGGRNGSGAIGASGGGGGSGTSSGGAGTTNQGFAGGGCTGDDGGGGGGAGNVGLSSGNGAHGGPGLTNTITCNRVVYAGGGGGGGDGHNGNDGSGGGGGAMQAGTINTGGGGGGGKGGTGGKGGSGIVIIRYKAGTKSAP
jgi:hypothetical protein